MPIRVTNSVASTTDSGPAPRSTDEAELRAMVAKMKDRERRIMELLRTSSPERIEHDLRNVLNELVLLRTLLDSTRDN